LWIVALVAIQSSMLPRDQRVPQFASRTIVEFIRPSG
jgi:hypothetical protein